MAFNNYDNGANPGYAHSNASSPPPGLSVAGGQQPNYNPNAQYGTLPRGNAGGGGDACCQGGCMGCLANNNPFEKANRITDDIYYNARYKRAMGASIVSIITTIVGAILVNGSGCVFINFAPFLYLIPIFLPSCNRKMYPFYWACLSIGSIILTIVSLFISLVTGCAQEGAIIAGIHSVVELGILFLLYRMDPQIKEKVKYCFASCGCLGEQAQLQTMVVNDNQYATSTPSPSPQPHTRGPGYNNGGYDAATLGPGSYVGGPNNFPSPPGSVNGGSYAASYASQPVPPPSKPAETTGYNNRNSAGKGSLYLDSPEFEGSRTGY